MELPSPHLFLLLLLLLFLHHTSTTTTTFSVTGAASPAISPSPSPLSFILSSCNVTLYPTLCYTTLSPYATTHPHLDPATLASLSISVSLSIARSASSFLSSLPPPPSSALRDCSSTFSDALALIQQSSKQMTRIISTTDGYGNDREGWRFSVNNVMTWMSGAMTNEDTCVDGFDEVAGDEAIEDAVRERVRVAGDSISVALALLNAYAATMGY